MCCKGCKEVTLLKGVSVQSVTFEGGIMTVTLDNGMTFTSTDLTGPQGAPGIQGDPGVNGTNGTNGDNGVGIEHITWTSNSAGQPQNTEGTTDTYTITLTDATTYVFTVYNGADGASGTTISWVTRTSLDSSSYTILTGNTGIVNGYDVTPFSEFTLPSAGLSIGDTVEIIDNKTSLPSETRIVCPVGVTIKGFGLSTTTRVECDGSVNGTIKLVYIATNTWAITNYLYDTTMGPLYPTFI
jgi:hypothetical protein